MRRLTAVLIVLSLLGAVRADDYVVVVLDTSGSMDEHMRQAGKSRIKVAQDALSEVLGQLPPTTKVGLLTFNGWSYDLNTVDRAKLDTAVRATRASGGTPLFQYIRAGADRLLKERQRQGNVGSYKLLVVTDGEATDANLERDGNFTDGTVRPGVLRDVVGRGLMVDVIGLDMKGSHSLRTIINGKYMSGDDPDSLKSAVQKSVAEVGFSGNDALAESAFAEIQELPESFTKAVVKGLTEYQNQPIGEKALVMVIHEDGRVEYVKAAGAPAETSSRWGMILAVIGLTVFLGFLFYLIVLRR